VKDFRDLRVWERVHNLTIELYKLTANFPTHELYGLTSQIRRCSSSIGANIAEGCGKRGNSEFQVSCRSHPVLPVNWIITYCWPAILGLSKQHDTRFWLNLWLSYAEC